MLPQLWILYKHAMFSRACSTDSTSCLDDIEGDVDVDRKRLSLNSVDVEEAQFGSIRSFEKATIWIGIDVGMWGYIISVAAFRIFYIHHWIWRFVGSRFAH